MKKYMFVIFRCCILLFYFVAKQNKQQNTTTTKNETANSKNFLRKSPFSTMVAAFRGHHCRTEKYFDFGKSELRRQKYSTVITVVKYSSSTSLQQ